MGSSETDGDIYEIERIDNDRMVKGHREYLIKWAGFPDSENTWTRAEDIFDSELIQDYENKKRKKNSKKVKKFKRVVTNEWESKVDKILSISKNDDKTFEVEYLTVDERKCTCPSSEMALKAPLQLIEFYENNITFSE